MVRIRTIRRMKCTANVDLPGTLRGSARARPAPAIVKRHGDKLGEAFK
jgi:hypothetical protein